MERAIGKRFDRNCGALGARFETRKTQAGGLRQPPASKEARMNNVLRNYI